MPNSDDVVGVTGEQSLTISRPSQRNGVWVLSLGVTSKFWLQFVDQDFVFQVVDLDTRSSSSGQPESGWREGQSKDFVLSVEVHEGALVLQVPDVDLTVLTSRSS